MPTAIDIVNLALSKIGEESITSFDDDSTIARLAKLTYEPGRDAVLRDHLWNFAMKRAALSALAQTPAWGFQYQYQLPADCIRLLEINTGDPLEQWEVEGGKILTDLTSPISIRYTRKVTEAEEFDALFVDALATYLAAEWCERITGSTSLREQLTQLYTLKLAQARSMDGQEGSPKVLDATEWILARF